MRVRGGIGFGRELGFERHEALDAEVLGLGDDILHQPVEQLHPVLHLVVGSESGARVGARVRVRAGVL
mgnify:CR=1 FL=1